MFSPKRNNKNNKNNRNNKYSNFDDWLKQTYKSAKTELKKIQEELEKEENERKRKSGRFTETIEDRRITPKSSNTIMDSRSHEGKSNKRGSIEGEDPISALGHTMGEGSSIESRRRYLEEKRQRISDRKIKDEAKLKKKRELRKAIIYSEILGPPISKRK